MSSSQYKIRTDILEEVKSAKFYSIIADEVSNNEELSLVIRYIHYIHDGFFKLRGLLKSFG